MHKSEDIAKYLESTNNITKPWLLVQLRLAKLEERRATISPEEYTSQLEDIHRDLMNLGEWWLGIEAEVFE